MTQPAYSTACPRCGGQLAPVALGPYDAPWLCKRCTRGYWAAELRPAAHALYRRSHDDFGIGAARFPIEAAVAQERAEAIARGFSLRPDQHALVRPALVARFVKGA